MELFFQENLLESTTEIKFSTEESRHISKVLRKKTGDAITVTNGKGLEWKGEITMLDTRNTLATKTATIFHKKAKSNLHIAIAPTKSNDRIEWFLEKATEIGITHITPILCNHSERRNIKSERFEKILIGALKQSNQFHLPKLNSLTYFSDFVSNYSADNKFIAHCREGNKSNLSSYNSLSKDVLILIGPEGDFSREEVELAMENDFLPIALGSQRLRTETAGIVACHTVVINREQHKT
ncbi:16S rRNA (uracil(1498)-N(3))-methyltransferase [Flavobacteriaceae bacterium]|nr:16S rRNA (uracil(1498)-N(3))-methyltransferase [Flavobacteriaceae bacterium]